MNTSTPSSSASTRSLGETARETAGQAAESASQYAAGKKSAAADQLRSYGSAIDESAKALEEQDPNIAWLTHQAAGRLQRAADYVRERDFRGLKADAENLARRHPVAFFGGMCVAGLILGSVIKASARNVAASPESDDNDLGSDLEPVAAEPSASVEAGITSPSI